MRRTVAGVWGKRGKGLQDVQLANGGIGWSPLRFTCLLSVSLDWMVKVSKTIAAWKVDS
jgi:hypothetical protein